MEMPWYSLLGLLFHLMNDFFFQSGAVGSMRTLSVFNIFCFQSVLQLSLLAHFIGKISYALTFSFNYLLNFTRCQIQRGSPLLQNLILNVGDKSLGI